MANTVESNSGGTRRGRGRGRGTPAWRVTLSASVGLVLLLVAAACVQPAPPVPTTTTTTTTTTSTPGGPTTTTTQPPVEPEPVVDFEQEASVLTEPGQSVEVHLATFDPDGSVNEDEPPAAPAYEVLGEVGAFDIADLDDGGLRVTSNELIGGIVISARVPGQELAVTTEIFSARTQPGVQLVPDTQVVFPVPNLPDGVDPTAVRNNEITNDGPGPFSWDDLRDRVDMPTSDGLDPDVPAAPFTDPDDVFVPFVLRGPAPAPGTRLLSSGGGGLAGEVVERPGLPSIERGGFSLVTVRTSALTDLYAEVSWEIDPEQVIAAGIVPESYGITSSCAEDTAPEDCTDVGDAPIETTVAQPGQPRGGRSAGAASASTTYTAPAAATAPAAPAAPTAPTAPMAASQESGGVECQTEWKTSIAQLKFGEVKVVMAPNFDLVVKLGNEDKTQDRIFFFGGYYFEVSASMSGKIQAAFSAAVECRLKELGHKDWPIPAGPAAVLLSVRVKAQLVGSLGIDLEGGPSLEFKEECKATHRFRIGFDAKYDAATDTRLGSIEPIHESDASRGCTFTPTAALGVNTAGIAAKLGIQGGVALKIPIGLQVGGKLSDVWQELLGDPDAGFLELASVTLGPRLAASIENQPRALQNRSADSQARVELNASAALGSAAFASLSKGMGLSNSTVGDRLLNIELVSANVPLISLYEPLKTGEGHVVDVAVNGEDVSGTAEIAPGDDLAIHTTMETPEIGSVPELESGRVWVQHGLGSYTELEGVELDASGVELEGEFPITEAVCEDFGTDPVELLILGRSVFDSNAAIIGKYVPAYGGSLTVQCVVPELEFDRDSVDFRADQTGFPATVNLKGTALNGEEWELDPATVPAWLNATPSSGNYLAQSPDTAAIQLGVDCTKVSPRAEVSATVKAEAHATDSDTWVDDTIIVTADCRKAYVEIRPTVITAGPAGGDFPVTIESYGPTVVYWPPFGGSFASADHPNSGVLTSGYSTTTVNVHVAEYPEACVAQPERSTTLTLRTEPRVDGDTTARGSAAVTVKQSPPGVKDCDPPGDGGAWGDPHIVSFDGQRYDAQTFGEYWYAVGGEDGPDVEVQTRHERWNQTGFGSTATIITGVAARVDGHLFEVYRRSSVAPLTLLKVDGAPVALGADVPLQVDDDLTIVSSGGGYQIHGDEVSLDIGTNLPEDYLRVWVTVPNGSDVHGLLGSPDGDPDNDIMSRDGTVVPLRDARLHGTKLLDFASSWRVTDPADSLFSETYPGFDDALSLFDPTALAQYRAQAAAYLDGVGVICSTPSGDDLDYALDAIAVEIMAGTPEAVYAENTCQYRASGRVTAELPDGDVIPVAGLKLRLTEGRLQPCDVVTGANGDYSCTMTPIAPEDLPAAGTAPVDLDIVATWPGRAGTVQTGRMSFATLSPLAGAPGSATADLQIDPATLVRTDVSGVLRADLTGDGVVPITTPTVVGVRALDADGNELASLLETVQPTDTGAFSLTKFLPGGTTEVELTARIGTIENDWPRTSFDVEPGINVVPFDVELRPALAVISGTLTDADDDPLGPTNINVNVQGVSGGSSAHQVTPAADGSYRLVVAVPAGATRVIATALVGDYSVDHPKVQIDDPHAGVNPMALSIRFDPPVLALSGVALDADGAPRSPFGLVLTAKAANGTVITTATAWVIPNSAGVYSSPKALPMATASLDVVADVGVIPADNPTRSFTGIDAGQNPRTFDVEYSPPRLALSGLLLDGAGVPRGNTEVEVRAYNSTGTRIHTVGQTAVPGAATGEYELPPISMPTATVRATVTYKVGPIASDWIVLSVDPVGPGLTERVFDIDQRSTTLIVSGVMTGGSGLSLQSTDVRVRAYDGVTLLATFNTSVVPTLTNGAYSFTREIPRASTRVQIEARVGVIADDYVVHEVEDLHPGPNQITFDVDHRPVWADLNGNMVGIDPATGSVKGVSSPRYVDVEAFDAEGELLYSNNATVAIAATDGSYLLGVEVPQATAEVRAEANVGEDASEYPSVTVDGFEPGTRTPVTLDVDYRPTILAVSGIIRVAGAPYVGPVEVKVQERDGDDVVRTRTASATSTASGAFSTTHVLRLASDEATVTVTPLYASGTAKSLELTALAPGRRAVPVTIDSSTTVLALSGHLEYFGEAQQGERQLRVRTYDADGSEIELVPGGYYVTVQAGGAHGAYSTEIPLRPDVQTVNMIAEVETPDGVFPISSNSFWITPNQQSTGVWNTHGSFVSLDATFLDGGAPFTQPFNVSMRAYNDDETTYQIQSNVYPDPTGRARVELYIPYDSFNGGSTATDPTDLFFDFYGFDGSAQYSLSLDNGADLYLPETTIDISQETRVVNLRAPQWSENTFTFTSVRVPSDNGGSFDVLGETTVDAETAEGLWDSSDFQYEVPVQVPVAATHLVVRLDGWDFERVIDLDSGDELLVDLVNYGTEVTLYGHASVDDGACGAGDGAPVAFRVTANAILPNPEDPDTLVGYALFENELIVPEQNGEFVYRFWVQDSDVTMVQVEGISEEFSSVPSGSNFRQLELAESQSVSEEFNIHPVCGGAGFQRFLDLLPGLGAD